MTTTPAAGEAVPDQTKKIIRFHVNTVPLRTVDIVAKFTIQVGDFVIDGARLRKPHDGRPAFVETPGRASCGISIVLNSQTRRLIHEAALERYAAETGVQL